MTAESSGLVLIVEDEQPIAELLDLYLRREGFQTCIVADGEHALEAIPTQRPAAVLLDVGLPGMTGTDVCRALRAQDNWVPVIFCTARDDEVDRILGLEIGGDDYITKPFSAREVVARVKAHVRRAGVGSTSDGAVITVGEVTLDRAQRRVTVSGEPVSLTATEFDLLAHLMLRPGTVFSRDQLLREVWGYASAVETRTVDVHVASLRSKLGEGGNIRTVRGVGYAADDRAN